MLIGFNVSPAQPTFQPAPQPRAIIAFGDSLTEGAGASSGEHAFPASAAQLFDPPRAVVNRGIGGQTSTQIAARQGGIPLLLGLTGGEAKNLYPHTRDWMDTFETGSVNGLMHECVHAGVDDNGMRYGDVRIHGTATGSFTDIARQIYGAIASNVAAAPGSIWTISSEVQMIGGTTSGIAGFRLLLIEADELGGYLREIAAPAFDLDGTRSNASATATATHPFIRSTPLLDTIAGSTIDITLRIFPGQFEAGATATSLQLTPVDGEIPTYHPEFSRLYRFDQGIEGWAPRIQDGHVTPLLLHDGKLTVENDDAGTLRGGEIAVSEIPAGKFIRVAFDIEITAGSGQIHAGGLQASGGSWATTTLEGEPTWAIIRSGHYELVFTSGNLATGNPSCHAITFVSSGSHVTWSLDSIVLEWGDESPQVEILSQSIDALQGSGGSSSIAGTLAGVAGILTADSGAGWRFTRGGRGDAVAVSYRTPFIPADAVSRDVQWLWAGRNNADTPGVVLADIGAMAAGASRARYLIGSILPSTDDLPRTRESIDAINAALATGYHQRYVDLLGALIAAASQTVGDQQDAAAGLVPRSLRADGLHLNDQGYAVVAAAWVSATMAMGW